MWEKKVGKKRYSNFKIPEKHRTLKMSTESYTVSIGNYKLMESFNFMTGKLPIYDISYDIFLFLSSVNH